MSVIHSFFFREYSSASPMIGRLDHRDLDELSFMNLMKAMKILIIEGSIELQSALCEL